MGFLVRRILPRAFGIVVMACCLQNASADEAALRKTFLREFRARTAEDRIKAVNKLRGAMGEKTFILLAKALRDPAPDVRKSIAECVESGADGAGGAIKPLCALLTNEKEEVEVRMACASALGKARYRADAIGALVQTISGIDKTQRHLFKFGADCTAILNTLGGQDFGAGKDTPKNWQKWWSQNRSRILKEDAQHRAEYKKSLRKR